MECLGLTACDVVVAERCLNYEYCLSFIVLLFEGCSTLLDLAYQARSDLVLVPIAQLYCHMLVHIFVHLVFHLSLLHLLVIIWLLLETTMLYSDLRHIFRFVSDFIVLLDS